MATYEYKCVTCSHITTEFRPIARRAEPATCAKCAAPAVVIFSVPRVQNLTASENSLASWGRNMRANGTKTLRRKIAETDAARRRAADEGRPNPAAEAAI